MDEWYLERARRIRKLLGPEAVPVRLSLFNSTGELRPVSPSGPGPIDPPVSGPLVASPGSALAILPLLDDKGTALGAIEVVASTDALSDRWAELIQTVTPPVSESAAGTDEMPLLDLALHLLRARTTDRALHALARFCFAHEPVPVAIWRPGSADRRSILATLGLTRVAQGRLRQGLARIPVREDRPRAVRRLAARAFTEAAGGAKCDCFAMGGVIIFVATGSEPMRRLMRAVRPLVEDTLERLADLESTRERSRAVDLSIAWTAHEIRSPLMAATRSLEYLASRSDEPCESKLMLRRSCQELEQICDLTESLLEWFRGIDSLKREELDLVTLVRESVRLTSPAGEGERVFVIAPGRVVAVGDRGHLRGALANVLRNALSYSPTGSPVTVGITVGGRVATLSIADLGPGIPAAERQAIFGPFVRGRAGRASPGNGLGLFVARQVIERHGGRIWVTSARRGATFHIELPIAITRAQRCSNPARAF